MSRPPLLLFPQQVIELCERDPVGSSRLHIAALPLSHKKPIQALQNNHVEPITPDKFRPEPDICPSSYSESADGSECCHATDFRHRRRLANGYPEHSGFHPGRWCSTPNRPGTLPARPAESCRYRRLSNPHCADICFRWRKYLSGTRCGCDGSRKSRRYFS